MTNLCRSKFFLHSVTSKYIFSDDTCTFQTDFCNWQPGSDDDFKWNRKTGADFQTCEECHGPDGDFEGSTIGNKNAFKK